MFETAFTFIIDLSPGLVFFGMCTSNDAAGGDTGTGDSSSGDSSDAGISTPFLATWTDNGFSLENDFLFGKPVTNNGITEEQAKEKYLSGENAGDMYLIQNNVALKNGKLVFQIREIEPEVSHIDQFVVSYFKKDNHTIPFVTSDHRSVVRVSKEDLVASVPQTVVVRNTQDVSAVSQNRAAAIAAGVAYSASTSDLIELDTNEKMTVQVRGLDDNKKTYLVLESKYRDWTIGEVFVDSSALAAVIPSRFSPRRVYQAAVLALVFCLAYVGLYPQSADKNNYAKEAGESILSKAFDLNVARADTSSDSGISRSLHVSYNDTNGAHKIEVIEPRYYQAYGNLVAIPADAVEDGMLSLDIVATKKHHITCAQVIQVDTVHEQSLTTLQPVLARHRRENTDHVTDLQTKNKNYLVTKPADVVDIEYEVPAAFDPAEHHFVLNADGYYFQASREVQEELGDWVSRLDTDSRTFLTDMANAA